MNPMFQHLRELEEIENNLRIEMDQAKNGIQNLTSQPIKKNIVKYVIGVAGGSCSGKTSCVKAILDSLHEDDVTIVSQDSYYFGGSAETNYDVPEAIDFDRLIEDLKLLINGQEIEAPMYDFSTHSRSTQTKKLKPAKIIILEGIL